MTPGAAIQIESWPQTGFGSGNATGHGLHFVELALPLRESLLFLVPQAGKHTACSGSASAGSGIGLGMHQERKERQCDAGEKYLSSAIIEMPSSSGSEHTNPL
jgi:hypothetical protein